MLVFRWKYFILTVILFLTEVLIALFVHDGIIRPYIGDYLVVILLYCGAKSFLKLSPFPLAVAVLLFAYTVETFQYFHLVDRLGLSGNKLARVVIGYGFEWWDMLAYTGGIATVLLLEYTFQKKNTVEKN